MLILPDHIPPETPASGPVSPLNAVWVGSLERRCSLPQRGHLLLCFPSPGTVVSCAGTTVDAERYLLLAPSPERAALIIDLLAGTANQSDRAQLLILWVSPPFIADMARFLDIPDSVEQLLSGVPLLQGDQLSALLTELTRACCETAPSEVIEDLFLEAVGEVLQMMRLRHEALLALARHKRKTVADLLPRLLLARQFVEARYSEQFTVQDVARYVALSEFHFARLFKTAFDITIRQYVIRLRLDEARRMLEDPETSVTETALHVGYSSLSSFIHAFSRKFGMTPGQYQSPRENEQLSTSHCSDHAL